MALTASKLDAIKAAVLAVLDIAVTGGLLAADVDHSLVLVVTSIFTLLGAFLVKPAP